ncbi:hypothetical protein M7I_4094 [Glarea lozoyensis 74030]|uniref:Uncharacterized protein n=1 Tax=Glarea lozoyensis (strain ATCC 74030 / MF5533) TaxID=1104152 RepID=H0EN91_GLAL7|nr:hypothetical protein M7I_4094 [Glarea lozoyensis 74030]
MGRIEDSVAEAIEMASRAAARLQDGEDTLAARYYELLYKAPRQLSGDPNDPIMQDELDITNTLQIISQATSVDEREEANLNAGTDRPNYARIADLPDANFAALPDHMDAFGAVTSMVILHEGRIMCTFGARQLA